MKTVKELETMLEEVRKDLEELKKNKNSFEPTPKGWKPKNGEKYWVAHYNLSPTVFICDERTITNNIIICPKADACHCQGSLSGFGSYHYGRAYQFFV